MRKKHIYVETIMPKLVSNQLDDVLSQLVPVTLGGHKQYAAPVLASIMQLPPF